MPAPSVLSIPSDRTEVTVARREVGVQIDSVGGASVRSGLVIGAIVCGLATAVMIPRLASPRFGLLDDGATIGVSQHLTRSFRSGDYGSLLRLERDRGRFRPLRFTCGAVQYAVWGASPGAFFQIQWLSLTLTALAISGIGGIATANHVTGLLCGVAYVLSGPVIESYYTLSKDEPPLVLWLALSVFFLVATIGGLGSERRPVKRLFAASVPPLILAYFTKETALAMVLVSGLWAGAAFFRERGLAAHPVLRVTAGYFIVNLTMAAVYWATRSLSGTSAVVAGTDSAHYVIMPGAVLNSLARYVAWYVRDFPFLVPLFAFVAGVFFASRRTKWEREWYVVVGCVLWIVGWTVVMLPWHSALEYYLLPAALGASILTGVGLSAVIRSARRGSASIRTVSRIVLLFVLCLGLTTLINGVTNGRTQVAVDRSNARLIEYLAQSVPRDGTVLVHLQEPSEYVLEMSLHLGLLKHRGDIKVGYLNGQNSSTFPGAFVVTPVVRNQPLPVVRLGVWEGDVAADRPELLKLLGDSAKPAWRDVSEVALLAVWVEKPVCLALLAVGADGLGGTWCGVARPLIETRIFEYGWEIYRI